MAISLDSAPQSAPASKRRLDFRDHRRELHDNVYVYAVVSRRSKGLSIGINLNADKVCNFACPYCQVDRTVSASHGRNVDIAVLETELDDLLTRVADGSLWTTAPFDTAAPALRRVNDVAFAGDGEPTSCPQFAEAVEIVGKLRDKHALHELKVHLLTNATLLDRPRVARGLAALDALGGEIWAKLDAGTPEWFRRVDGTQLPFRTVLRQITHAAQQRPIVLQCLFCSIGEDAPDDLEVRAWANHIGDILAAGGAIRQVQVTTIARAPADPSVGPLSHTRLNEIADAARVHDVDVQVFPGLAPAPTEAP